MYCFYIYYIQLLNKSQNGLTYIKEYGMVLVYHRNSSSHEYNK